MHSNLRFSVGLGIDSFIVFLKFITKAYFLKLLLKQSNMPHWSPQRSGSNFAGKKKMVKDCNSVVNLDHSLTEYQYLSQSINMGPNFREKLILL